MLTTLITISFIGLVILSAVISNRAFKKGIKARKVIAAQILSFALLTSVVGATAAHTACAAEPQETTVATETADTSSKDSNSGLGYIAMALCIGLGSLGAGIAVAASAPAAIGATSENPKSFGKSLVFVVLAEGVMIFSLLISIFIYASLT